MATQSQSIIDEMNSIALYESGETGLMRPVQQHAAQYSALAVLEFESEDFSFGSTPIEQVRTEMTVSPPNTEY